jgi:hypothetical protein
VARYLVSGISALVSDVRGVLGGARRGVGGRGRLEDVPEACEQAGPGSFDGYIHLPATLSVTGDIAIDRVHRYFRDGVLARFPAMSAALPHWRRAGGWCS